MKTDLLKLNLLPIKVMKTITAGSSKKIHSQTKDVNTTSDDSYSHDNSQSSDSYKADSLHLVVKKWNSQN